MGRGLPIGIVTGIAPGVVHGHAALPIHAWDAGGGHLLLRGTEIAAVLARSRHALHALAALIHAVVDEDIRLEGADVGVEVLAVLVGPGRLPLSIKPEHSERTVAFHEFTQLGLHVGDVPREIGPLGRARGGLPRAARQVVGVMPIHDGVVEAEFDALSPALLGQLLQRVALEGCGIHDVPVVVLLRLPHAEAIVVLAGDHDVLHAGILRHAHPLPCIEPHGIELRGELAVVGHLHLLV